MENSPLRRGSLLAPLRELAARARGAHHRSRQEWIRRIESPQVRRELLD